MRIRGRYIGHVCFFDPTCIRHYFEMGTPMSIYFLRWHWHVLPNTRRFKRVWGPLEPVARTYRRDGVPDSSEG